jgi:hypothetical protein
MGYDVTMEELYTKGPGHRVCVNTRLMNSYDTLEEVVDYLKESSNMIQREHRLIREWTEEDSESCIHKILFTRTYGVGRLLRKYVIHKHRIAKYDDSLI